MYSATIVFMYLVNLIIQWQFSLSLALCGCASFINFVHLLAVLWTVCFRATIFIYLCSCFCMYERACVCARLLKMLAL